jgi:hypothetical protein
MEDLRQRTKVFALQIIKLYDLRQETNELMAIFVTIARKVQTR